MVIKIFPGIEIVIFLIRIKKECKSCGEDDQSKLMESTPSGWICKKCSFPKQAMTSDFVRG